MAITFISLIAIVLIMRVARHDHRMTVIMIIVIFIVHNHFGSSGARSGDLATIVRFAGSANQPDCAMRDAKRGKTGGGGFSSDTDREVVVEGEASFACP